MGFYFFLIYMFKASVYDLNGLEVRNKDSIRVFVELTTPINGNTDPTLVEDNLIFTLESGVRQKVNLNAYSWDADSCSGDDSLFLQQGGD